MFAKDWTTPISKFTKDGTTPISEIKRVSISISFRSFIFLSQITMQFGQKSLGFGDDLDASLSPPLSKSLEFSEPLFLHLYNGYNNVCPKHSSGSLGISEVHRCESALWTSKGYISLKNNCCYDFRYQKSRWLCTERWGESFWATDWRSCIPKPRNPHLGVYLLQQVLCWFLENGQKHMVHY